MQQSLYKRGFLTTLLILLMSLAAVPALAIPPQVETTSYNICAAGANWMNEYNLIVFDNLSTTSDVEYKTITQNYTSGNSANFGIHLDSNFPAQTPSLEIAGTIASGNAVNVNKGSVAVKTGTSIVFASPNVGYDVNGRRFNINQGNSGANAFVDANLATKLNTIKTDVEAWSTQLKNLTANNTASIPGGQPGPLNFNVNSKDANGVAVFNVSGSAVFNNNKVQQIEIKNTANATFIIINVSGTNINWSDGNKVGSWLTGLTGRANTIWNFYEATTLTLNSKNFMGALLAPKATVTSSANIDGATAVKSLTTTSELHKPLLNLNCAEPEPETAQVILFKDVDPNEDTSTFDLYLDDEIVYDEAGNGDYTALLEIEVGEHAVYEKGDDNGNLGNYTSSIVCYNITSNAALIAAKLLGGDEAGAKALIKAGAVVGSGEIFAEFEAEGDDVIFCLFTNTQKTGELTVFKYNDKNNDGNQDTGENGIVGWGVKVFNKGDNPETATPVAQGSTGAAGTITFDLPVGDYLICEENRAGWTNTDPGTLCQEVTVEAANGSGDAGGEIPASDSYVTVTTGNGNDYQIKFLGTSNDGKTWNYEVKETGDKSLSHWVLSVCEVPTGHSGPGTYTDAHVNGQADPTTGKKGVKWDMPENFGGSSADNDDVATFSVTFDEAYGAKNIDVTFKTGGQGVQYGTVQITGPDCEPREDEETEPVVVTFGNYEIPVKRTLTIRKNSQPENGMLVHFDWPFSDFNGGNPGDVTVVSGGNLQVGGIDAGIYNLTELVPDGWNLTSIVCNNQEMTIINNGVDIDMTAGNADCTFTNTRKTGDLSVYKFRDNDGNGQFNGSDAGINNWEIKVFAGNANPNTDAALYTKLTSSGYANFDDLPLGEYIVCEENRAGWTPTNGDLCREIELFTYGHSMSFANKPASIGLNLTAECRIGDLLYWRVTGDDDTNDVDFTWNGPGANDGSGQVDAGAKYYFTTVWVPDNPNTTIITWFNPAAGKNETKTKAHNNAPCVGHVTFEKEWRGGDAPDLNGAVILTAESSTSTATCTSDNGGLTCVYTKKSDNSTIADLEVPFGESYSVAESVAGWVTAQGTGVGFEVIDGFVQADLPNALNYDVADNRYCVTDENAPFPKNLLKYCTHTVINEQEKGGIQVTKAIVGNGTGTFEICVAPAATPETKDCKSFNGAGSQTWSDLTPGSYIVTESDAGDDWTVAYSVAGAVTVVDDQTTEVTVTNTYVPPQGKIIVIKDVVNGTDNQDFNFNVYDLNGQSLLADPTLDDDGNNANDLSNTWMQEVTPGNYAFSEAGLADWSVAIECQSTYAQRQFTLTDDENNNGKGVVFGVDDDETVTCTFKNTYTPRPGYIRVIKDIIGDKTGTFTICVDNDSNCQTFNGEETKLFEVAAGSYSVYEQDAGANWNEPTAQNVTVAPGETKDVTVTNTYVPSKSYIRVTKDIVGDATGVFTICVNNDCREFNGDGAQHMFEVSAGQHVVSEQDAGTQWIEPQAQQVQVTEGQTVDVTVTNTYVPPVLCPGLDPYAHLSAIIEPTGNPNEWRAKIFNTSDCKYDVGFAAYKKPSDVQHEQVLHTSDTRLQIGKGETVIVLNAPNCAAQLDVFFDASHLGVYNTYVGKQAQLDQVPLVLPAFATNLYGQYGNWYGPRLLAYKHVWGKYCVEQQPVTRNITIQAQSEPMYDANVTFDGDLPDVNGGNPGDFAINGFGGMYTFQNLTPGVYNVMELVPDGYTLTSVTCNSNAMTIVNNTVAIDITSADATCTFYNTGALSPSAAPLSIEEPVVLDDDQDGVSNELDLCAGTADATVDANGCGASQLDDDADGVSNAADACPTTVAGVAVDAAGCEVPAAPQEAPIVEEPVAPASIVEEAPAETTPEVAPAEPPAETTPEVGSEG